MKGLDHERIRSVLAVSVQGIGNTILALPALTDVKRGFPGIHLTLMVADESQAKLFTLAEPVDQVVVRPGIGTLPLHAIQGLFKGYDLTLVMFPHGAGSAWLSVLSGGRNLIGHMPESARWPLRWLYRRRLPIDRTLHDVKQNQAIPAALGIDTQSRVCCPFQLPSKVVKNVLAMVEDDRPMLVIHPGCDARFPEKRWPARRFGKAAKILSDRYGLKPVVVGGPGEEYLVEQVIYSSEGAACVLPEKLDLVGVAALLSLCRMFLGNDSGIMNLAQSLDVPTASVFGPSEHVRTGPVGRHARLITAGVSCSPCWDLSFSDGCKEDRLRCMMDLPVEKVVQAVSELMEESAEEFG